MEFNPVVQCTVALCKEWDVRPQTGSRPASSSSTTVAEGLSRPVSRQQDSGCLRRSRHRTT
eukprot:2026404-Amphidinium_carterae.1